MGMAQIKFYPGRYAAEKCSILPVGDATQYIPDDEVCVRASLLGRSWGLSKLC